MAARTVCIALATAIVLGVQDWTDPIPSLLGLQHTSPSATDSQTSHIPISGTASGPVVGNVQYMLPLAPAAGLQVLAALPEQLDALDLTQEHRYVWLGSDSIGC